MVRKVQVVPHDPRWKLLAREFPEDIDGYVAGKDGFIKEMDQRATAWRKGTA